MRPWGENPPSERRASKRLKFAFGVALLLHAVALAAAARLPAQTRAGAELDEIRVFKTAVSPATANVDLVEWPQAKAPKVVPTDIHVTLPEVPEKHMASAVALPKPSKPQRDTKPIVQIQQVRPTVVAKKPQREEIATKRVLNSSRGSSNPTHTIEQPGGGGGDGSMIDMGASGNGAEHLSFESGGTAIGNVPGTGNGSGSGDGSGIGAGSGSGTGGGSGSGEGTGKGSGIGSGRGKGEDGEEPGFVSRVADRLEPEVIRKGALEYPKAALADGVEGTVKLKVLVTENGTVEQVEIISSSGDKRLDAAAKEYVSRWRYRPAVQDSKPRRVYSIATVKFSLE